MGVRMRCVLCLALVLCLLLGGCETEPQPAEFAEPEEPVAEAPAIRAEMALLAEMTGEYLNGESACFEESFMLAYNVFAEEYGADPCTEYRNVGGLFANDNYAVIYPLDEVAEGEPIERVIRLEVRADLGMFIVSYKHDPQDTEGAVAHFSAILSTYYPEFDRGEIKDRVERWIEQGGADNVETYYHTGIYLSCYNTGIDFMVMTSRDAEIVREPVQPIWVSLPITREEAGLDTLPSHPMNGYRPNEYWLWVAQGSLSYTDEHFSWSVRHGTEFPFPRFWQQDMVLFGRGFCGEVIAGIQYGDSLDSVVERLGEPTLRESYRIEPDQDDSGFYTQAGVLPVQTFLHYKGDGFYVSFMGRDSVEMIGLKRAAAHDYDPDIMENWYETIRRGREGWEEFFQSPSPQSGNGAVSISNVGFMLDESDGAVATVYNDFQGNLYRLYRMVGADDPASGEIDPDALSPDLWLEDSSGMPVGVRFQNEDSNFQAFREYMYQFAVLEQMLRETANTSPGGKYRLITEELQPNNISFCFRRSDWQARDVVHTWMGSGPVHWLDDEHFILSGSDSGRLTLYRVGRYGELECELIDRINDAALYAEIDVDLFGQAFTVVFPSEMDDWLVRWHCGDDGELVLSLVS